MADRKKKGQMDRYQQSRAKADLSDISKIFKVGDIFTIWPAISEIISEKTKFVPHENKPFENEKVTVLSLRKNGDIKMPAQKTGPCARKLSGQGRWKAPACLSGDT